MNHGLEIRSKPTIPDFFSPPQKKRAPKERFPVVNPMAKKLEISSTLNRKNRFEKDGLFWLQSFTNQIGRNKEMDYSIWNKWHIHIRYMICIYIYYLYVYIYNLYVYIYIYYIHTCTYIYIYTFIQFLGVLGLSPNFGTFDSPNPLDRKSPSNWPVSCIADSFI